MRRRKKSLNLSWKNTDLLIFFLKCAVINTTFHNNNAYWRKKFLRAKFRLDWFFKPPFVAFYQIKFIIKLIWFSNHWKVISKFQQLMMNLLKLYVVPFVLSSCYFLWVFLIKWYVDKKWGKGAGEISPWHVE